MTKSPSRAGIPYTPNAHRRGERVARGSLRRRYRRAADHARPAL